MPLRCRKIFWFLYLNFTNFFVKKGYSQYGEDILFGQLCKCNKGFYIDIGCNHPKRFSNTYLLYKKGWSGLVIDANYDLIKLFKFFRPRDKALFAAVGNKKAIVNYYIFDESPLNGVLNDVDVRRILSDGYKVVDAKKIHIKKLSEIFKKYLPKNVKTDLMSLDVEGMDFEVLLSNDWSKYMPQWIMVEDEKFNFDKPGNSKIYSFLRMKKYKLISVNFKTMLYKIDHEP